MDREWAPMFVGGRTGEGNDELLNKMEWGYREEEITTLQQIRR